MSKSKAQILAELNSIVEVNIDNIVNKVFPGNYLLQHSIIRTIKSYFLQQYIQVQPTNNLSILDKGLEALELLGDIKTSPLFAQFMKNNIKPSDYKKLEDSGDIEEISSAIAYINTQYPDKAIEIFTDFSHLLQENLNFINSQLQKVEEIKQKSLLLEDLYIRELTAIQEAHSIINNQINALHNKIASNKNFSKLLQDISNENEELSLILIKPSTIANNMATTVQMNTPIDVFTELKQNNIVPKILRTIDYLTSLINTDVTSQNHTKNKIELNQSIELINNIRVNYQQILKILSVENQQQIETIYRYSKTDTNNPNSLESLSVELQQFNKELNIQLIRKVQEDLKDITENTHSISPNLASTYLVQHGFVTQTEFSKFMSNTAFVDNIISYLVNIPNANFAVRNFFTLIRDLAQFKTTEPWTELRNLDSSCSWDAVFNTNFHKLAWINKVKISDLEFIHRGELAEFFNHLNHQNKPLINALIYEMKTTNKYPISTERLLNHYLNPHGYISSEELQLLYTLLYNNTTKNDNNQIPFSRSLIKLILDIDPHQININWSLLLPNDSTDLWITNSAGETFIHKFLAHNFSTINPRLIENCNNIQKLLQILAITYEYKTANILLNKYLDIVDINKLFHIYTKKISTHNYYNYDVNQDNIKEKILFYKTLTCNPKFNPNIHNIKEIFYKNNLLFEMLINHHSFDTNNKDISHIVMSVIKSLELSKTDNNILFSPAINKFTDNKGNPLIFAIANYLTTTITEVNKYDLTYRKMVYGTSDEYTIRYKAIKLLKTFISNSSLNLNVQDHNGEFLIHKIYDGLSNTTQGKHHLSDIFSLMNNNTDINVTDKNGYTLLHKTINHYSKDILTTLLKMNIDINIKNHEGKTPLILATELVELNHITQIVQYAKKHNINIKEQQIEAYKILQQQNGYYIDYSSYLYEHKYWLTLGLSKQELDNATIYKPSYNKHYYIDDGFECIYNDHVYTEEELARLKLDNKHSPEEEIDPFELVAQQQELNSEDLTLAITGDIINHNVNSV